jgi:signal transduction histidine kinase
MANLTVIQGQDRGKVYDLRGNHIVMGRDPHCEVSLTDHSVSRHHAELRIEEGRFHFIDLNSSNGSFVNGVKVTECIVRPGDQIRLGSAILALGRVVTSPTLVEGGPVQIDEDGRLVDAAITATAPAAFDPGAILAEAAEDAQARRQIENLSTLLKFSAELSGIIDTQQLLETILDLTFEVVDADRAFILLLDAGTGRMEPRAVRYRDDLVKTIEAERLDSGTARDPGLNPSPGPEGPPSPKGEGKSQPQPIHVSRTIVNYCLSKGEGVLSSNAMQDRRFERGDSVQDLGIRSAICVPIKARERIVGIIHTDTQLQQAPFTENDLRMMTAVGYLSGLAVENARLVETALHRERLVAAGEAVASISHYVKNILQGLEGGASVIEDGLKQGRLENIGRGWGMVRRNQGRISDLVLDMLHYTRKSEPNLERQNVNAVVREAIDLAAPRAAEKQVEIATQLNAKLPELWIDGSGLHHACLNILVNAVDAVEPRTGRVTVTTTLETRPPDGREKMPHQVVVIAIADNGQGIAEDQLGVIFQAFHSTKGGGGTGLGLAVSRKIIEEHRGTLTVESHVGAGSTFTITLPAAGTGEDAAATVINGRAG